MVADTLGRICRSEGLGNMQNGSKEIICHNSKHVGLSLPKALSVKSFLVLIYK